MRVISGAYRGRRLVAPIGDAVRPTSDMVKEAMFNILQFRQAGTVLDLFAGTGSLGIEAISRGATNVVFCDNNPLAVKCIRENLSFVDDSDYEIFFGDYASCLRKYANEGFDVVLIDPPYMLGLAENALNIIAEGSVLAEGGVIIVEHASNVVPKIPSNLAVKSCKKYGNKSLTILEWANEFS